MKKFILLISSFFAVTMLNAQEISAENIYVKPDLGPRNEISIGYGGSLINFVTTALPRVVNRFFDVKVLSTGGYGGYANLGYTYRVNRTLAFGASFGYNRLSLNVADVDKPAGNPVLSGNLWTAMGIMKINWFQHDYIGMYSKVGLGAMLAAGDILNKEFSGNVVLPTFHLSAVCLEAGGKHIRGFFEIGAGFQGMVQAGARVRF